MSDLTLTLSVPRQTYAIGEEVSVQIEVHNQTSRLIVFPEISQSNTPQPIFTIRQPDGKTVVYDPIDDRPDIKEREELPHHLLTGIEPRGSLSDTLLPDRAIPLDKPGAYTISARFKWKEFDLESEPVTFTMAAIRIKNMVISEMMEDPEVSFGAVTEEPATWGGPEGHSVHFQIAEDSGHWRPAGSFVRWYMFGNMVDHTPGTFEWNIAVGKDIYVYDDDIPQQAVIVPAQTSGIRSAFNTMTRLLWSKDDIWYCNSLLENNKCNWIRLPSPKPIAQGLRHLYNFLDNDHEVDAFVLFQGETVELGHAHFGGEDFKKHTPLRPIAQLGPGFVAAQVMLGPPTMGSPVVLFYLTNHPTGTQATFMRIDSKGTILAKTQSLLSGYKPMGPIAMKMRVRGSVVEAAFPVQAAQGLHVVRLATTVELKSVEPPVISAPIQLEGPTPTMVIDYSRFPTFFPNGVGLLLRQPGDKAFFWTEVRGLKPLPFTLHDKDEAIVLGKRSSWYVLVNSGFRIRGEIVESLYKEFAPAGTPLPALIDIESD